MSKPYTPPAAELLFTLQASEPWQRLRATPAFAQLDDALLRSILDEGARFCEGVLAPIDRLGDEQGCRLVDGRVHVPPEFRAAFKAFIEGGWAGLDLPESVGGQGLPTTLAVAFSEMLNGACVAFGMMACMVRSGAHLILEHGEPTQAARIAGELLSGTAGATIVITEPQAGSDVGAIRTRAMARPDGSYALDGSKIFITCADQDYTEQIHHFVLARGSGGAGLSLFVVPKQHPQASAPGNGVRVVGLEKKMGLKASPTCTVAFDGALGDRLGDEGRGLSCLFTMMNLMRLEVAVQSVGIASAATQRALRYAQERHQGGDRQRPIVQHGDVQRMLMQMQALTSAMRALVLDVATALDLARDASTEAERDDARVYVEFMLPICKAWMSDTAFAVANLGVQVLGGYGYVADGGLEQYVRDSRVMAIYEGTNGIQAQDLLKRKLIKAQSRGLRVLAARIRDTLAAEPQAALRPLRADLEDALRRFEAACSDLMPADAARLDLCAAWLLQWAGLLAGAWSIYRLAVAAQPATGQGHASAASRIAAARFYFSSILPDTEALERKINQADAELAGALAGALAADAALADLPAAAA